MMRTREPAAVCMCTCKALIITVIFFTGDSCNVSYYSVQESKLTSVLEKWLICLSADQTIPASVLDIIV